MIDPLHFRVHVIRPALLHMKLHSLAAENLLLGTAIAESQLKWLKQHGTGPALGLFQIEPTTHDDVYDNFLAYHDDIASRLGTLTVMQFKPFLPQLIWNLGYATAMARLIYYRRKEPLPASNDLAGLAHYWKDHYNSKLGAGTVDKFMSAAGPHILATQGDT